MYDSLFETALCSYIVAILTAPTLSKLLHLLRNRSITSTDSMQTSTAPSSWWSWCISTYQCQYTTTLEHYTVTFKWPNQSRTDRTTTTHQEPQYKWRWKSRETNHCHKRRSAPYQRVLHKKLHYSSPGNLTAETSQPRAILVAVQGNCVEGHGILMLLIKEVFIRITRN